VGQQVAIGQPIMAVLPENDLWVVANFKETQMRHVRPGQRAELEVDTFSGRQFSGHVNSIAAGTGATFALLPPDNATGNFTKVVQRVPVKIVFDPGQAGMDRLRSGLSVVATIATGRSTAAGRGRTHPAEP
jgi:membrane fusion protein, multidrug efflux system